MSFNPALLNLKNFSIASIGEGAGENFRNAAVAFSGPTQVGMGAYIPQGIQVHGNATQAIAGSASVNQPGRGQGNGIV
jgi:hypothetical protein